MARLIVVAGQLFLLYLGWKLFLWSGQFLWDLIDVLFEI